MNLLNVFIPHLGKSNQEIGRILASLLAHARVFDNRRENLAQHAGLLHRRQHDAKKLQLYRRRVFLIFRQRCSPFEESLCKLAEKPARIIKTSCHFSKSGTAGRCRNPWPKSKDGAAVSGYRAEDLLQPVDRDRSMASRFFRFGRQFSPRRRVCPLELAPYARPRWPSPVPPLSRYRQL